jgi:hypothetical protein
VGESVRDNPQIDKAWRVTMEWMRGHHLIINQINWNWFATTLGAPRIGFLQAYGLSLVISAFTSSNGAVQSKKDEQGLVEMALWMFLYIFTRFVIFAGLGYAVHAIM